MAISPLQPSGSLVAYLGVSIPPLSAKDSKPALMTMESKVLARDLLLGFFLDTTLIEFSGVLSGMVIIRHM